MADDPAYIIEAEPGVGDPPDNAMPVKIYGALASEVPGVQPVSVTASSLPEGAATEAGLTALRNAVQNQAYPAAITGYSTAAKQDDLLAEVQNLVELQEPFPTGLATSSKQDAILVAIDALADILGGTIEVTANGLTVTLADGVTSAQANTTNSRLADIAAALGGTLTVTPSGPITVNFPGGATESGQSTIVTTLQNVLGALQGTLATSTTNGATAAKQDAAITLLQSAVNALQAPLAIASPLPVTDNGGSLTVDGTVGISGTVPVSGNVGINGTVPVSGTVAATQSGTWSIMSTPNVSASSAALTPFRNTAQSVTPTQVKNTTARVYQYSLANTNSVFVYVNLYNALAANVTPGTTQPMVTLPLPPGSTLDGYWSISHNWSTAVTVNASTNVNGSGAPTNGVLVGFGYA